MIRLVGDFVSLEDYVKSPEFDQECRNARVREAIGRVSTATNDSECDSEDDVNDDTSLFVAPSSHEVSKFEAYRYYAGLDTGGRGPKLIYRTSSDKFTRPSGPEAYSRMMKLLPVPEDHELGKDGLWDRVRDRVVESLDGRHIAVTAVDLVRFTWLDKNEEREIDSEEEEEEEDDLSDGAALEDLSYEDFPRIEPVEYGTRHTTNPTIWIAVCPDTLTGVAGHESAIEILALLKDLGVAGVWDCDPLKDVVDELSTTLSLCITGLNTTRQGTLGCYFRAGNDLYAVTARHAMFDSNEPNQEYNYRKPARKMKVVVIGNTAAFTKYLTSIQTLIADESDRDDYLERCITSLARRLTNDGNKPEWVNRLEEYRRQLSKTRITIDALKAYYVDVRTKWSKTKDRVIGYVVWAPPIGVGPPPHRYSRDLCVIKLDKAKFKNFRGNVLSLGPEISLGKFIGLLCDLANVPLAFHYPYDGLLSLQGILSAAEIKNPDSIDLERDPIRRVIKRGVATNTTVGCLSAYMSHTRKYCMKGHEDSVEAAILPHDPKHGHIAFSRRGDSGALIVDGGGRLVALLTGGTSNRRAGSSVITYASPMEWVWELVKGKFPGADLHFDDLEAFLADVI